MKTLNEKSKVAVEGHVLIKDFDTGEVLLDKHNAINFQNFALAVAHAMGGVNNSGGNSYIVSKLAFGYGGTSIDANGNITYNTPKVTGTSGGLYSASQDNTDTNNPVDLKVNVSNFYVADTANQPYSDLVCNTVLDYGFPADAQTLDNASDFDTAGNFVFDEIGLVDGTGNFLTHLIFHPIQKSKNRKLEIVYTLRIRAGV
jgi:hypothetical protein